MTPKDMMNLCLGRYLKFLGEVEKLGRAAVYCPLDLIRMDVPEIRVGEWDGTSREVTLWFSCSENNEPHITEETHRRYHETFMEIRKSFAVHECVLGFHLSGQPGVIMDKDNKPMFLSHGKTPYVKIKVFIEGRK